MNSQTSASERAFIGQWLVLGGVLLILLGYMAYALTAEYRSLESQTREELENHAKILGNALELRLNAVNAALADIRSELPGRAEKKDRAFIAFDRLPSTSNALRGVRAMTVFDAGGTATASNRQERVGRNFGQYEFFRMAVREPNPDTLYIAPPVETAPGAFDINLVRMIPGPDGQFAGIVSATLDNDELKLLLESMQHSLDKASALIHGGGKLMIIVPEAAGIAPGRDLDQPGSFFARHRDGGQQSSVLSGVSYATGNERIAALRTIQPAALAMSTALVVAVTRDPESVFAPWREHLYKNAALFFLIALASLLGLLFFQRRLRAYGLLTLQNAAVSAQQRNRYQTVIQTSFDGFFFCDASGRIVEVNESACRMLGYTQKELLGMRISDLDTAEAPEQAAHARQIVLAGRDRFQSRYRCKDGRVIDVEIGAQYAPMLDGQFFVFIHDIGERKHAERQLHSAQALTQRFLDHLPGMAYVKDGDSRALMVSKGVLSVFGMTPEMLLGKTSSELFPGKFGERITASDRRVIASGQTEVIQAEYAGRHFESSKFAIEDESGKRLVGGIMLDVTDRYRYAARQGALLEIGELGGTRPEKEFIDRTMEIAERLTDSSIGFLHFVGNDQESIEPGIWTKGTRKRCTALHQAHHPISRAGIWADAVRDKRPAIFNDYPSHRARKGLPEGHAPLQRLIVVPIVEQDAVRILLGVGNKGTDYDDFDRASLQLIGNDLWRIVRRARVEATLQQQLAELKALNHRLEEAHNQLLQSEKLAAIGQLAAGIAHEINNPIGFVNANLGSLAEYASDLLAIDAAYGEIEARFGTQQPRVFERIRQLKRDIDHDFLVADLPRLVGESQEGLTRVRRIVQDLKDFSRVGETEWQWVDLHQGIDSTLNIVWNEIKYKAEVKREFGQLPPVHCVPSQLNQVVMNLLVNAAQAIEERGLIVIRTGCADDLVWMEVGDNGRGIPPDNMKRIFDPFYTTKPVGKGTGLGLSLSWGIVERHKGTIEVYSELGAGTTFRVILPVDAHTALSEDKAS